MKRANKPTFIESLFWIRGTYEETRRRDLPNVSEPARKNRITKKVQCLLFAESEGYKFDDWEYIHPGNYHNFNPKPQ